MEVRNDRCIRGDKCMSDTSHTEIVQSCERDAAESKRWDDFFARRTVDRMPPEPDNHKSEFLKDLAMVVVFAFVMLMVF